MVYTYNEDAIVMCCFTTRHILFSWITIIGLRIIFMRKLFLYNKLYHLQFLQEMIVMLKLLFHPIKSSAGA